MENTPLGNEELFERAYAILFLCEENRRKYDAQAQQEARVREEKNKELFANANELLRVLHENMKRFEARRDLYRSLSAKGANEVIIQVRNGQPDTSTN
ncbi:MAG: hypothetical protein II877_13075 [Synergistaceae bacterium]|nr:hypothetical protein [Synergistaceae bacterium]MBQ6972131.1 hypothetical protein [Synergistaceae bacterium]